MNHNEDAYAAMLLTMALSPNKEEYARPLCTQEFRRMERVTRDSRFRRIGKLMNLDISGFMIYLGLSEEEGYRAYTLLHRGVQLSYALDGYMIEGLDVVTVYDDEYPPRLFRKLGDAAPPFFYRCGNESLLAMPSIAIVGISGVKTKPEVREAIERLARDATAQGYTVITGGELGVSRVAANAVAQCGGTLVDILGGGLHEHMKDETIARLLAEGRCALLSLEHPDAMFTVSHAIARNKLLFSLTDAAFVFSTDGRRGESEALQNRYCDWIYAWEGYPGNQALIARGAKPLRDLKGLDFRQMSGHWSSSRSEQLNIFDMLTDSGDE